MLKSEIMVIGNVAFPEFTAERLYMIPFTQKKGLPKNIQRWQDTVDAMLSGIKTSGDIYLMVDQGIVGAGQTQRRSGIHIEGNWYPGTNETIACHGGGTGRPPGHRGYSLTSELISMGSHGGGPEGPPPGHKGYSLANLPGHGGHRGRQEGWASFDPELVILASDVMGCAAYIGEFDEIAKVGGDCSHIDVSNAERILLQPNIAYCGTVTTLHESLPLAIHCQRTLVRLNVPLVELDEERYPTQAISR